MAMKRLPSRTSSGQPLLSALSKLVVTGQRYPSANVLPSCLGRRPIRTVRRSGRQTRTVPRNSPLACVSGRYSLAYRPLPRERRTQTNRLDLRHRRPRRRRSRDRAGRVVSGDRPTRVRLISLCPGRFDAGMAPSLRRASAGFGNRIRGSGARDRWTDDVLRPAMPGVVHRDTGGVRLSLAVARYRRP